MRAFYYREELAQMRVRAIEDIKLIVTKLFKNHSDLVNEICLADPRGGNPIYQEARSEDEFTTFIDDIQVIDNELVFNYSSEIQDLIQRPSKDLTLDNCISILEVIENLKEIDLDF